MFEPIYTPGFDLDPYKMEDWELVFLAKEAGWKPAGEILVVRHLGWVKPMVVQLTRNEDPWSREDMEDAQEEAALAIYRAIDRYDLEQYLKPGGCSFHSFLAMVVHDWVHDFVRKVRSARKQLGDSLDAALEAGGGSGGKTELGKTIPAALASTRDNPAAAAELAEQIERLHNAIAQLPPQQREVMELHLKRMKIHEIAHKLGTSDEAMKGRKKRAIDKLRDMLT